MNNKKQTKQPLFAEVNLTGDEFRQSPGVYAKLLINAMTMREH